MIIRTADTDAKKRRRVSIKGTDTEKKILFVGGKTSEMRKAAFRAGDAARIEAEKAATVIR